MNGLYPGISPGPIGLSKFLYDLNYGGGTEAQKVYTFWGTFDDVILYGDLVWGQYTSRIPSQTGEQQFNQIDYSHFHLRDWTAQNQYDLIKGEGASESKKVKQIQ